MPSEILENAAEEEANRINEVKMNLVRRLSEEGVGREEALEVAKEAGEEVRVSPQYEEDDDPLANDAAVDLGECEYR